MSTVAPLIAAALYTTVSHAAPYWLGVVLMLVAAIVVARAHIDNTAKGEGAGAESVPERAPLPAA
jgi:DHA1 family tetracycline resistance protein-like MFS transporter